MCISLCLVVILRYLLYIILYALYIMVKCYYSLYCFHSFIVTVCDKSYLLIKHPTADPRRAVSEWSRRTRESRGMTSESRSPDRPPSLRRTCTGPRVGTRQSASSAHLSRDRIGYMTNFFFTDIIKTSITHVDIFE